MVNGAHNAVTSRLLQTAGETRTVQHSGVEELWVGVGRGNRDAGEEEKV